MMQRSILLGAGIFLLGFAPMISFAQGHYESASPDPVGGKVASQYAPLNRVIYDRPFPTGGSPNYQSSPVYNVNGVSPDFYSTYQGGTSIPVMDVGGWGNARYGHHGAAGVAPGAVGGRPAIFGGRPGRGRMGNVPPNPYEGIDPMANNPYAGNTITRGPRDFLMKNPPNIGP